MRTRARALKPLPQDKRQRMRAGRQSIACSTREACIRFRQIDQAILSARQRRPFFNASRAHQTRELQRHSEVVDGFRRHLLLRQGEPGQNRDIRHCPSRRPIESGASGKPPGTLRQWRAEATKT
jgi:hypothetical protein